MNSGIPSVYNPRSSFWTEVCFESCESLCLLYFSIASGGAGGINGAVGNSSSIPSLANWRCVGIFSWLASSELLSCCTVGIRVLPRKDRPQTPQKFAPSRRGAWQYSQFFIAESTFLVICAIVYQNILLSKIDRFMSIRPYIPNTSSLVRWLRKD